LLGAADGALVTAILDRRGNVGSQLPDLGLVEQVGRRPHQAVPVMLL
jgi:hypothetical protein